MKDGVLNIKIVTDSTCDLPEDILKQYDITSVPVIINMDGVSYQDGVNMTRAEFYERLPNCKILPTTSAPNIDAFKKVYEKVSRAGIKQILSIHVSEALSSTIQMARLAAEELRDASITVIDSGQISLGTGFIAREAAKIASEGLKIGEILARLEEFKTRVHVLAVVDTLEYLMRSGRMSRALGGLGTIFNIKPILKMHQGEPTVERVRTHGRASRRLIELMANLAPFEDLAIVHTSNLRGAKKLMYQMSGLFPGLQKPWIVDVTPAIGVHLGPGVAGFACIQCVKEA